MVGIVCRLHTGVLACECSVGLRALLFPPCRVLLPCPAAVPPLRCQACRGAIMFGDELSLPECEALMAGLAKCRFPFQCAHGRPSLSPLVTLAPDAGKAPGGGK